MVIPSILRPSTVIFLLCHSNSCDRFLILTGNRSSTAHRIKKEEKKTKKKKTEKDEGSRREKMYDEITIRNRMSRRSKLVLIDTTKLMRSDLTRTEHRNISRT